jgi:hypothetical protein
MWAHTQHAYYKTRSANGQRATAQRAQPSPVSAGLQRQSSEICLAVEPDALLLGRRPLRHRFRRTTSVRLIQIPLQHFDLHHQVDHLVQLLRGCRLVWNRLTLVEAKVRASASRWALSGAAAPPGCVEPARASASPQRQVASCGTAKTALSTRRPTVSSPRPWAARAAACVSPIRFEMAATKSSPLLSCEPAGHLAKTAFIAAWRSSSVSNAHIVPIRPSFAQATGGDTRWRTGRLRAPCRPKAALVVNSATSTTLMAGEDPTLRA